MVIVFTFSVGNFIFCCSHLNLLKNFSISKIINTTTQVDFEKLNSLSVAINLQKVYCYIIAVFHIFTKFSNNQQ